MMSDPVTPPADACSPDADRAGPEASSPLPEWLVHLLALLIHFVLEYKLAARLRRSPPQAWWHDRPDLPAGSIQGLAASIRGPFGNAIAWMCRRRGIGPGHPDWPELSRAIVAFGGSVKGFRAGAKPLGLHWSENPNIIPGTIGETAATPAAKAMVLLLSQHAASTAPSPAPTHMVRSAAEPARPPAFRRPAFARAATGPPTGPPAVWAHQLSYARTTGARAWLAPSY
jgi:hypothetical protein